MPVSKIMTPKDLQDMMIKTLQQAYSVKSNPISPAIRTQGNAVEMLSNMKDNAAEQIPTGVGVNSIFQDQDTDEQFQSPLALPPSGLGY